MGAFSGVCKVSISRAGKGRWRAATADADGAVSRATTLVELERSVREDIAIAQGLTDEAAAGLELAVEIDSGDAQFDRDAAELRHHKMVAKKLSVHIQNETVRLAAQCHRRRDSKLDTAYLLGCSPQRISQLVKSGEVSDITGIAPPEFG